MEIKVYRHIYHKDVFLARNWHLCGGADTTEFYFATRDVVKAIENASRKGFMSWAHSFLDENGKTKLVAKMKDSKAVEIDGYTGTLVKELVFPVTEFECVILREV